MTRPPLEELERLRERAERLQTQAQELRHRAAVALAAYREFRVTVYGVPAAPPADE